MNWQLTPGNGTIEATTMGWRLLKFVLASCAALAAASAAAAHTATIACASVTVARDGHLRVRLNFDTLAFALNDTPDRIGNGPMDALLDGPTDEIQRALSDARDRFATSLKIDSDGRALSIESLEFPGVDEVTRWKRSGVEPRLPVMLEASIEAYLPPAARSLALRFPDVLGQVILTIERPGMEARSLVIEPGRMSETLPLGLADGRHQDDLLRIEAAGRSALVDFKYSFVSMALVLALFLLSTRRLPWRATRPRNSR